MVLTNLKIEYVNQNGMSVWNRESGGQRRRAHPGREGSVRHLTGTARSICLASVSPKEGMNLGAMTPFDISISPLASLGQATCSSCLLITVCLSGREHASQGDTSVHSAYRLLFLATQLLNCHFGLCGSPAGAGMMSLCHSETESV